MVSVAKDSELLQYEQPNGEDYAPPIKGEQSYLELDYSSSTTPCNSNFEGQDSVNNKRCRSSSEPEDVVSVCELPAKKRRLGRDIAADDRPWLTIIEFLLDGFWMTQIHSVPAYGFQYAFDTWNEHLENCKTVQNIVLSFPKWQWMAEIVSERNLSGRLTFLGPALKYLTFHTCDGLEQSTATALNVVTSSKLLESAIVEKETRMWKRFYKQCKFPWKPSKSVVTPRERNRDLYLRQFEEDPSLDDYRKGVKMNVRVEYHPWELPDPLFKSTLLNPSLDDPLLKPIAATGINCVSVVGNEPSYYDSFKETFQLFTEENLDLIWPNELKLPRASDFLAFIFPEFPRIPDDKVTGNENDFEHKNIFFPRMTYPGIHGVMIEGEFQDHFDFKERYWWVTSQTNTVLLSILEPQVNLF